MKICELNGKTNTEKCSQRNTYSSNSLIVFSALVHEGFIPYARSIKFLHFLFILNRVFSKKVPESDPFFSFNTSAITLGGTL